MPALGVAVNAAVFLGAEVRRGRPGRGPAGARGHPFL